MEKEPILTHTSYKTTPQGVVFANTIEWVEFMAKKSFPMSVYVIISNM